MTLQILLLIVSKDRFSCYIDRTLYETRHVFRWLINQLTASFDEVMMGIDKRQLLIQKEIDYQP